MEVRVLRLGHRPERDQRVTTHVGLAARAFGAAGMYLAARDAGVVRSIEDVVERWGGSFTVDDGISPRRCIREWKERGGVVVHLTMYGIPLQEAVGALKGQERVLAVVGAEKVPGEIYGLADYNVSVTTQPHSEISSLAVFLDYLFAGKELGITYPDATMKIRPSPRGKQRDDS